MLDNGRFASAIVSCDWLYEHQDLEHLIILDASVNSVLGAYIPNAKPFDIKDTFSNTSARFPNTIPSLNQFQNEAQKLGINTNSLIVVYDDKGLYWSPRVWWLFKTFGFENIAVLDGGLPEWSRLNYETVSELKTDKSQALGNFVARFQKEKVKFFDDIASVSEDNNCLILDARSEARFQGKVPEPRAGLRSGTIPNSKNLHYKLLFNGNCLKPKTKLKALFDTFDSSDKQLTFSCGSGITACILALAAELSDYKNTSVYDGSWTEYGTLTQ